MTFEDYWGILRRSWVFVVLTPLLGALVAFGISKAATPVYQAESTVFVTATSKPGTTFFVVSAEASTADEAAAMANNISSAITEEIPDRGSREAIVSTTKRGSKVATITVDAEVVRLATPPIGPISPKTLSNTSVGSC